LIPYFASSRPPGIFAQELDERFRIKEFLPFAPHNYVTLKPGALKRIRNVGQSGLLAFLRDNQSVSVGEADELRTEIAKTDPTTEQVFFNLEASFFLGDPARLEMALVRASEKLADPAIRDLWVRIEKSSQEGAWRSEQSRSAALEPSLPEQAAVGVSQTVGTDALGPVVTAAGLASDLYLPNWAAEWIRLWENSDDRQLLVDAAESWIRKVSVSGVCIPDIVYRVLNTFRENLQFRQFGEQWLLLRRDESEQWGELWLLVTAGDVISDELSYAAIDFLRAKFFAGDAGAARVCAQIIVRLIEKSSFAQEIPRLVTVSTQERSYPSFATMVCSHLSARAPPPLSWPYTETMYNCLATSLEPTNSWAYAYISLVSHEKDVPTAVVDLGKRWLWSNMQLNVWKDVWETMQSKTGETMSDLGYVWLSQARRKRVIWPDIMAGILMHGEYRTGDINRARHWLRTFQERANTESYRRLAAAVELASRGRVIDGEG
jgi:hypothetical protein